MTKLSPRERQICDLLVLGLTNKEVAERIGDGISHRTVEDHRQNIFKKYGVNNAVKLVRQVYSLDLRDMVG